MSRPLTPFLVALALVLAACGDSGSSTTGAPGSSGAPTTSNKAAQTPSASTSAKKVATPTEPSTGTAAPADDTKGLVAADYEDEAEKSITVENLDDELAKIEKEIHAQD